ncbi:hypothetical protein [Flavobacterium sp. NRK F7]|uniref:hypothetical protein n=1 Tax=Flavobacterium sp. NRK F7 TaxID=2954930 RepID=UPI0020908417|nr:hypothetical protein [Flavobacterium sp. NRK F7]MCO6162547.1 hypothetical protein [Flavobacterium sp. NRK F7]
MRKLILLLLAYILFSCSINKNEKMNKTQFNFYTEYNQFYIEDKGSNGDTGSAEFWSEEAIINRLALDDGIIGVGTQSYGNIKGEITILDKPTTDINFDLYDHIVEGGINIKSGELQILNCPDNNLELSIKVECGKYRVRVYGLNFSSVKETDLAHDSDNDFYKIEIWKSEDMQRKVLKQWEDN